MLCADDPLPFIPERVLVAGVSGSGKTTLSGRIGALWGLRHIEIDGLFHGANWTPRPEFLDDVRAFAAEDRWVTEWQYTSKGTDAILAPRAQLALWLDYPYRVVRGRLMRRTLARGILRRELWNGNREKGPWTSSTAIPRRTSWRGRGRHCTNGRAVPGDAGALPAPHRRAAAASAGDGAMAAVSGRRVRSVDRAAKAAVPGEVDADRPPQFLT